MRRTLIAVTTVVALAVGYGAADAYDQVPGVLTIDEGVTEEAPEQPDTTPVLPAASEDAPVPTEAGLTEAIADDATDPAIGNRVGVVVRDALTGDVLYSRGEDRAQKPASTAKLLTAAAVSERGDLSRTMRTEVVADGDELVLVAAGDTMLAPGRGDQTAVEGRAGLTDLAEEVADSLEAKGESADLSLRLDATYAVGERYPSTWNMADVAAGYTQGVSMIGLAGDRPEPGQASPKVPERKVLKTFGRELRKAGVDVDVDDSSREWQTPAPEDAEELGAVESAPLGDVLALALDDSDNALTENVARQTALADGADARTAKEVAAWVKQTLEDAGVDMTGVTLRDSSGLSGGQAIPARVVSDVMQLGITGSAPSLTGILAELPVAGLTGTLHDRFLDADSEGAAGIARAKTGTLTGTSALAGTTTTEDGRLLTYVILADRVPMTTGTLGARAVLDRMVADITACGCR